MTARSIELPNEIESSQFSGTARPINLEEKDISRFRSLISAPLKGILKSLPDIARMHDPVSMFLPKPRIEEEFQTISEKALPTRPEFAEKALERFGEAIPYASMGGVGGIAAAGAGAVAGQAAEELGAGPVVQGIAETLPAALPGLARKIIPSSAEQKAILELGRKAGLTEEQLAPLMPENLKRRFFGKTASVGEKAKEKLSEMRKGGSQVYQFVKGSPEAKKMMSSQNFGQFAKEMEVLGKDMPHAIRSQLKNDALDFVKSVQKKGGASGEDLINFYKDVSSRYNLGRTQLELFKGPIKKAISSIDPELAKNFDTANKIWQKQAKISKTLTPGEYEGLLDMGKTYATAASLATGDASTLIKIFGYTGYRKFSTAMLTSPRLQNLVRQSQHAIEKNNLQLLKKTGDQIEDFVEKED